MINYIEHKSVLLQEVLLAFSRKSIKENSLFADLTFGGGGHSLALAKNFPKAIFIVFDQDPDAYNNISRVILKNNVKNDIIAYNKNFKYFKEIVESNHNNFINEYGGFNGILLDLGISTHHLFSNGRGFSFRLDGPLDMRMDYNNESVTAYDLVNNLSENELAGIFYKYGEDRFSKRIAKEILKTRINKKIKTTNDLENIVFHCYPKSLRNSKIHPATRIFQALRIVVNDEIKVLTDVIPQLFSLLAVGGRLVIISFHSLEDRIVKNSFKNLSVDKNCKILTKKPITASNSEISDNPRSRSAKLRILEKV